MIRDLFTRLTNNSILILCYAALGVLLLFSVLFYLERTCFIDIAFQAFHIINSKDIFIQVNRFGAAFIHAFPVAGVWLKLPLQQVLLLYSVSFIIENILLFVLLAHWLKQKEIALILALFNVLLVSETFYWTTSEIKQGMSLSIFFGAVLLSFPLEKYTGGKKIFSILGYTALLVTLLFFHPLIIIPMLFVTGYWKLHHNQISNQTVLVCAAIIILTLLIKYFVIPIPWYDQQKYSGGKNFLEHFPNYFALPSFAKFVKYVIKDWYLYGIMLITVLSFYAIKKHWLKLLWLAGFTLAYLIMVNVTHPNGADKFYIESFYLMLGIFVLFPFVFEILPLLNRNMAIGIVTLIFILRLNTIYHAHNPFTERISWLNEMLATHEGKFIVSDYHVPMQKLKMTWGIPYETMLLTSLHNPDSCRSFISLENTYHYGDMINADNYFFAAFGGMHEYKDLNPDYFRPAEGKYRILNEAEVIK